ncbi:TPA: CHAP domain-containing protein [Streptococcus suis]|nr:CHAP domain-containing protein [Streptococcus suis]HEM2950309.1 CHAP domain-containing protein [Streptococcus suis]HEM3732757.1 CHAP domain-containing protein [Streptococcus suis]HEM3847488.1 CHAP domain-containing protein [Streptococcus suis]HEM3866510.1 CHAP domain-containing protein [Streptococcus suis]
MKEDKKLVKQARQNFRSNLKSARMHYRKEVRALKQTVPKKGRFRKSAQNSLFQEKKTELKENLLSSQKEAEEKFLKEITYVSPRLLKVKEIKNYRLPQAQERLRTARKHLSEVKLNEKQQAVNPKFTFQKENPSLKSRFQFHQEKSFDRLSAEKDVSSAKREVKQLKKVQKSKKNSTKVKAGLGLAASESLDLIAQEDDLDGLRTMKDTSLKARRYGRFTYQAGKVAVKSGQTGVRFTKTKFSHGKERFQNFKKGKGFTRQKPLKPRRRYHTFLKLARKQSVAGFKGIVQAIKGSMTFFSDEDQEELKELTEEGNYLALQELDNPFQGQTDEDSLNMTYRYGYEVIDEKPTLHHHIILEAKEGQVIVAPMDGKVSLDGENVVLTSGKGVNKSKLTLFGIHSGRVSENQQVLAGDIIGQTKDGMGLKVTYQKVDDDTDKLVYVNPAFYFPKVIQVQTTILPTIGQFGGDEFERAKAIYDYLKSKGATAQAIAAILGNWSVESSINPKRAEGDYLSPPVGATDGSWDDEGWLSLNGPTIYNGRYPNILKRGLGLGQWTDTSDGSRRHTLLLEYAKGKHQKWYDLGLQLDFMLHGDSPYYTNWLKDFFKNSGSPASLAQLFLIYWEGNSGDKLLERQTRASEWYYQVEKGFSQPNGGTAQSDPKALEAVRGDLFENSIPGGGDGMGYAYGQCTWGVAARINQLGLKLKGKNGEKIPIISTMGNGQDWVRTAASLGGETGTSPQAGAILSFAGGGHGTPTEYGHVAFVEKVYPDGSFLISETNYNGNPNYTFRKLSGVDSSLSFAYTTK